MAKKTVKPGLPQSESAVVMRSKINYNPKNVKRHDDEEVKEQLKNFRRVGYLGGIIFNEVTTNLVSGHKRLMAQDLYYGNTPETPVDYPVRVELVHFDQKTELETLIYMDSRSTNTFQSYDLLAEVLPEIDAKLAGLDQNEIALIALESPLIKVGKTDDITTDFKKLNEGYEQEKERAKEAVKAVKAKMKSGIQEGGGAAYVTLSFDSYANKCQFLEQYGYDADLVTLKGEQFLELINENGI
jgi:hypothetical protein